MKNNSVIQFLIVRVLHRMTVRAMKSASQSGKSTDDQAKKSNRLNSEKDLRLLFGINSRISLGDRALASYAAFTKEQLERMPESEYPSVQVRMYQISRRMGSVIRKALWIRNDSQARKVVFWLYRNIGITLEGSCPGKMTVSYCYFSQFYNPQMCKIMSAMDRGIFAGLFGGGELTFETRMTEGCSCCKAVFTLEEKEV